MPRGVRGRSPQLRVGLARGAPEPVYDWFTPDVVIKAEYYEVETKRENLLIFRHVLSEEEQRWGDRDRDRRHCGARGAGLALETKKRDRKRIHKYVLSGAEVLEDCGFIAGDCIPVVPVYGKRWFVDNQERFRGHVSKRMDAQRIYNAKVSKLSETDSAGAAREADLRRRAAAAEPAGACGRGRSRNGTPMRWSSR
jgi:hypothetical protein